MKKLLIIPIRGYQILTGWLKQSGIIKDTCVFYPTCSFYAIESIEKHGMLKGTYRAARRILRCHPWQKNHFDPA
jgi:putative membrane protein insertion efficiency factor